MSRPVRNRLPTQLNFNLLDFEDFPKVITEINRLRWQSLELDRLRHAKGKILRQFLVEDELDNEMTYDFSVRSKTSLPEVKKALLALYKGNRVLRENSLDLQIVENQNNAVKIATDVCCKILQPLEEMAGEEEETELLDNMNEVIKNLTLEKNELENRRKTNLAELKKRQEVVRLLEKRVSSTAMAQDAVLRAALDDLNAGKELSESEMLLLALHRWKTLNFRLRKSVHDNYLRYVEMFARMKKLEEDVFREISIAPPAIYEACAPDYEEKAGTSLPPTPCDSAYDIVFERPTFPFLLANLSESSETVTRNREKFVHLKNAIRDAFSIVNAQTTPNNPPDDEFSNPGGGKGSQ